VQVLLRHDLFADPDRELTPATLDQVGVDSGLLLDERRRTGSAWTVVSDLAESNADVFHDMTPSVPARAPAHLSVYAAGCRCACLTLRSTLQWRLPNRANRNPQVPVFET
jgi:hypothetical protein